jgi:hypothetical protein
VCDAGSTYFGDSAPEKEVRLRRPAVTCDFRPMWTGEERTWPKSGVTTRAHRCSLGGWPMRDHRSIGVPVRLLYRSSGFPGESARETETSSELLRRGRREEEWSSSRGHGGPGAACTGNEKNEHKGRYP